MSRPQWPDSINSPSEIPGTIHYCVRVHVSEAQFRRFLRLFALDLDATRIAILTGWNRRTMNRYVQALRRRMATVCEQQSPYRGSVEIDESYVGRRRVRGKRGRGAGGKTIVFGIFKRNGSVHTEIVPTRRRGIRPEHFYPHLKDASFGSTTVALISTEYCWTWSERTL